MTDAGAELAGFGVVADEGLEVRADGRVLVGGSPLRIVRLSDAGAGVVRRLLAGEPVPAGRGATALVRRLLDGGVVHPVPPPGPCAPGDVTVVVPVRGTLPAALLDGLGPVAAVVVVDDASPVPVAVPAGTTAGVPVRVVRRPARGGPAAARNTGLEQVATPVVAFVDADCRTEPGWLNRLLPHLADPRVAVVAPRIAAAPVDGEVDGEVGGGGRLARYEQHRSALDMGPDPARVRARSRVSFVPSAALVARTAALREHHGFDPDLTVGEDVDLVWRLDEAGWTVRYEPAAVVGHRHRTTPGAWLRRRFDYGTSAGPLARRHPGALAPAEAAVESVAAWALLAAGHPVAGAGAGTVAAMALARRLGEVPGGAGVALRLAAVGHLAAGRLLATALVRPWWPVTAAVAVAVPSRRLRTALAVAAVAPALLEWRRRRPPVDPVGWVALRLLDDAAYGAGVWVGAARARTADPLVPEITRWPRPTRYSRWRATLAPGDGTAAAG